MVLAPVWFVVASGAVGTALVAGGADATQLEVTMADHVPTVILVAQLLMGLTALLAGGFRGLPATLRETPLRGRIYGAGVGVSIAVLYLTLLSPAHKWLQRTVGDWMGGGWYIALTALFAGTPLMLLRLRLGLGAAVACHLALNLVEFAWLVVR